MQRTGSAAWDRQPAVRSSSACRRSSRVAACLLAVVAACPAAMLPAATAGAAADDELVIAAAGRTAAVVVVAADAGTWERRAASDLVDYVERMSGGRPALADTPPAIAAALASSQPVILVGGEALRQRPDLHPRLTAAAKPRPLIRADAVVRVRDGGRVYLAGTSDDAHYYAVAMLLADWGCRWYMPTALGECVPRHDRLAIGRLDQAYGSPFEVRRYWVSWNGSTEGRDEFMRRNYFNDVSVPNGHALGQYTASLVPPGKTMFNVPIAEDATADHVARQIAPPFAAGRDVQLGMEDGVYESDSPLDRELFALRFDDAFLAPSATDAFLTFYNKVAERLQAAHPESRARIGFLAYANMTLPPARVRKAARPLVAYLAPIDIDPIHPMDSPLSAPRRGYRDILAGWADVMDGRLVIYDYDQAMLVWRDVPAPSLPMIRHDIRVYRDTGILGVDTESRGAFATIGPNLCFRGQLLWNPDLDIDRFAAAYPHDAYGPAAAAMAGYWEALHEAWRETIVTEHEQHVIPAIYTPAVLARLSACIAAAREAIAPLAARTDRTAAEDLVLARIDVATTGHEVLTAYTDMVAAAAGAVDYAAAVRHGERGLAARERLTRTSDILTTYVRIGESGAAWWPGEVEQVRRLAGLTDGTRGTLVARLPLEWLFRTDSSDRGLAEGWADGPPPAAAPAARDWREVRERLDTWQPLRSDLYLQAQGAITADHAPFRGVGWYRTEIDVPPTAAGRPLRLMFPGLFNQCRLFVNGAPVADRTGYQPIWWRNAYEFEWDVDLTATLRPGPNTIALRIDNPHHMGGMFRRPFLYAPVVQEPVP